MDGANGAGFGGMTEHLTQLSEPKKVLPRKIGTAVGASVLMLGFLVFAALKPGLLPLALLLNIGVGALTWFLWRFTDVEYEYLIAQGEMSFSAVYGKRQRRDLYTFSIKLAEEILPYDQNRAACDGFDADETRFYAASFADPDTYCALIRQEDGRRVRLFFQGTPKALEALRRCNPRAFVSAR